MEALLLAPVEPPCVARVAEPPSAAPVEPPSVARVVERPWLAGAITEGSGMVLEGVFGTVVGGHTA